MNRQSDGRRQASRRVWRLYFVVVYLSVLLASLNFAFYGASFIKGLLAITLLNVCLYPTARYFARDEGGVPVFPALCLSYAVQFAIPIFTKEPGITLVHGVTSLNDSDVVSALLLSIGGVCALQLGYYGLQTGKLAKAMPVVDLHLNEKKATIYCVLVGILLPVILGLRNVITEQSSLQFAAVFTLLQNQQLVVIGILGWLVYSGRGTQWHRLLLFCVVGIMIWRGLSSAFLEQAVIPVAVLFVTRWRYSKRLSIAGIASIVFIIIFLSPVKGTYRQVVWSESAEATAIVDSKLGSALLWVEQASRYWIDTLTGDRELADATSDVTSRTDLIHQFAHIYSLTPEIVPFQYGGTYSYFAVALIPRAVWPDKPQAGSANSFFAVAYNITTEEGVTRTTFGVSLLGEGYINFGIPGVVFIMALQGVILIILQHIFGGAKSGAGGQAVFLAFFIFFLNGVGTSAEIFFGNIVQNLLCSCFLLWWARERPSLRHHKSVEIRGAAPFTVVK
ncbi:MAG TPA: hypothetical protein VF591_21230 [Pyrinomonadaceae bacterium]|jgi:hypothetical protein